MAKMLVVFLWTTVYGQGYRVEGDSVVVTDTREEWGHWRFPQDIADVSAEGRVQPRYFRGRINASLDADVFGGGVSAAGSNAEDGAYLIDGDPETYWGPDRGDLLEDWWVEVDLGRLVSATEIVLRFAEEGKGDPFRQFRVLVSTGDPAFAGSALLDYRVVGGTRRPNRDERVFRYVLEPAEKTDENWTGAAIQYVQIVVTDTGGDRAEEVPEEAYEALTPEARGAVLYFGVDPTGALRPVTRDGYEVLPLEERGPIRYYRRERPRLAEVEVYGIGDNIGLGVLERGGSFDYSGLGNASSAFDGSFPERWEVLPYLPHRRNTGTLIADLGALFWIDAIRIVHTAGYAAGGRPALPAYILRGSDGLRAPDGTLLWATLTGREREHIVGGILRFEDRIPLRKLRFLLFRNLHPGGNVWINEIQLYGEGFVPEVTLASPLIELGGGRSLRTIGWAGDTPPGTEIEIRTRTGDDVKEIQHFFDNKGKEISELRWNGLPGFSKGPVVSELTPGKDWSGWSPAYRASGVLIASPSPRKYMLIEAKLTSEDPGVAPGLEAIRARFARALVSEISGEVSPQVAISPGEPTEFAFFIRPMFVPGDSGFNRLRIYADPAAGLELVEVGLGRETDFPNDRAELFRPEGTGRFVSASGDTLPEVSVGDTLTVRLPRTLRTGGPELLRIRFLAAVFVNGTTFAAQVSDVSRPDVWQRVDPGDATFLSDSRTTSLRTTVDDRLILDVRLEPNPFTPNGDGVGDEVRITFSVAQVNVERPVRVTIWDLGGRKIRERVARRRRAAGAYALRWRGEDDRGRIVPPGAYICRLRVDADSGSRAAGVVSRMVYCVY